MSCPKKLLPYVGRVAPALASRVTDSASPRFGVVAFRDATSLLGRSLFFVALVLLSISTLALPASAKTAMQIYVESMQPGTNLGNTLDATPTETSWGQPLTTQNTIQQIAAQGFKSIRIPVTWFQHCGPAPTYTVDPAWMNRVQQIVDWSLQSGMKVMLNMHHDSAPLASFSTNHDALLAQYTAVWTQVATRFKDYPSDLMLEAINEPTFNNVDDATSIGYLNELESVFYHTVRNSGGMNATRPLVLPSLYTNTALNYLNPLKTFIVGLNDPNIIATVHYYGFWPFSVNNSGYTKFDSVSISHLQDSFDNAYNTLIADGIPVVCGEIGLLGPDNVERGEFLKYFEYVLSYMRSKTITHMLWDASSYFDRNTLQWKDPDLYALILQTLHGRASNADTDLVFVKGGAPVGDAYINLNLNGNSFVSLTDGMTTLSEGDAYKLQGSLLTIKGSYLAQYASGAFGEKTVLSVNVNSGPAWRIHVRNYNVPVASAGTGTIGGMNIPVAFNGDKLATMEAKYTDGSAAGSIFWNSYQGYNNDFVPNEWNNTITLPSAYFTAVHSGTINLAFHFWSGNIVRYQIDLGLRATAGGPDYTIYNDSLAAGWNNWGSWAPNDLGSTAQVHSGTKSISVSPGGWGALVLQNGGAAINTSIYHSLVFWIHGGATGGQKLGVGVIRNGSWQQGTAVPTPVANTWTKVQIPLTALSVEGASDITGIFIMDWSGNGDPTYYVDDIALSTSVAPNDLVVTGSNPMPSPLTITKGGFTLNRRTNTMVQTVTITNPTSSTISGPIYLILDSLSSTTSLTNATGMTSMTVPTPNPYITATSGGLAPNASVTVTLQFAVPAYGSISYSARTLSGGATP